MNVISMMEYGHKTVLAELKDLPMERWATGGVCGVWSVKDILAHLISYEHWFEEVIGVTMDSTRPTPTLAALWSQGDSFNDNQVAGYQDRSAEDVLKAYETAWQNTMTTSRKLATDLWDKVGLIPWYGEEYTLAELMVYAIYAHKREHSAQIAVYHDAVKAQR
jgi:uncharacterized damage-inducible protein DinB